MSKIRPWMVLVAGAVLIAGILASGLIKFILPNQKAIAAAQQREQAAKAEIWTEEQLQQKIKEAEQGREEARQQAEAAGEEFEWFLNNKMPYVARNEWWRAMRLGHGLTVQPFSTRYGPTNTPIVFERGRGLMLDMWFELREDLGPLIYQFFEDSGCQVGPFSLPAPQMSPYGAGPITIPISFTVVGEYERVLNLMRRLGDFPRLISVGGFSLTPVAGTSGRVVQTNLPATIHILPRVEASQLTGGGALPAAGAAGMPGMGMPGMGMPGMGAPGMGGAPGMAPGAPGMAPSGAPSGSPGAAPAKAPTKAGKGENAEEE